MVMVKLRVLTSPPTVTAALTPLEDTILILSSLELGRAQLTSLQPINVLCVQTQKELFVKQKAEEVVGIVGPVVAWVQLLGQHEEGLRIVEEIAKLKDGFWVRNIILLEVMV